MTIKLVGALHIVTVWPAMPWETRVRLGTHTLLFVWSLSVVLFSLLRATYSAIGPSIAIQDVEPVLSGPPLLGPCQCRNNSQF